MRRHPYGGSRMSAPPWIVADRDTYPDLDILVDRVNEDLAALAERSHVPDHTRVGGWHDHSHERPPPGPAPARTHQRVHPMDPARTGPAPARGPPGVRAAFRRRPHRPVDRPASDVRTTGRPPCGAGWRGGSEVVVAQLPSTKDG